MRYKMSIFRISSVVQEVRMGSAFPKSKKTNPPPHCFLYQIKIQKIRVKQINRSVFKGKWTEYRKKILHKIGV